MTVDWTWNEALVIEGLLAAGPAGVRASALEKVHNKRLDSAVQSVRVKLHDRYRNGLVIVQHYPAFGYVMIGRGDILAELCMEARNRLVTGTVADRLLEHADKEAGAIFARAMAAQTVAVLP